MGHGLTLALATLFFLWLGWLLDQRIGSEPLFMILGALLGAAAGFYNLYRHLVIEPREGENGRK
jgi:F0F1-type ATP synthase assembly protein I